MTKQTNSDLMEILSRFVLTPTVFSIWFAPACLKSPGDVFLHQETAETTTFKGFPLLTGVMNTITQSQDDSI